LIEYWLGIDETLLKLVRARATKNRPNTLPVVMV